MMRRILCLSSSYPRHRAETNRGGSQCRACMAVVTNVNNTRAQRLPPRSPTRQGEARAYATVEKAVGGRRTEESWKNELNQLSRGWGRTQREAELWG